MNSVLAEQQWKAKLVAGVLTAILSGMVLAWPGPSILVVATLFGVYLLVSGFAEVFLAFTLPRSAAARVLWFIAGALSVVLAILSFRHFGEGYAVLLLSLLIGVSFTFLGVGRNPPLHEWRCAACIDRQVTDSSGRVHRRNGRRVPTRADRRVVDDETQRSVLIDALMHGRLSERCSLWEAADCLRLPTTGPFVVIAADIARSGVDALPHIEAKLRSLDVFSAWRGLPDVQVGIVHVNTDRHLAVVLALVSRVASGRVGVSARFDDLRDTARGLRQARVTLRGRADPGSPVSVFDGSILATAAVSAPEVMVELASPVMECFADLADEEREVLFETFPAWRDHDGSMRTAGEMLFCHPNTVRYRMHRIEQRTGRSLTRPRDVAELCLAFEVQRRLM